MTVWQMMIASVFIFLIAIVLSFKKTPSKLRMVMRILAILMIIAGVSIFFMFKNKMEEVRACPSNVVSFYAKDGVLCFGYENVSNLLMDQRQLEISDFKIVNDKLVITSTPHNGDFQIRRNDNNSGFSIVPYTIK
ncbi:hypothetical protein I2492_18880 [Budviciaceae bacterium CWB-B4]|uniref:Uncharacterized protein n=1 Tax=Limnobaculum xujianqingii TaxID=2738837 RepID=A0A9D7ALD7_9GAMM|nr:hypothetical protein [Limnobaculum xujianqingii]MBK5075086.1 hypothetical protein [Limnobaculum xujianqingii]MBK5178379.1 hypothetical protein [Limnobaculum xujianqingii]